VALKREFKNTLRKNRPGHSQDYLPAGIDHQSAACYPAAERMYWAPFDECGIDYCSRIPSPWGFPTINPGFLLSIT